MKGIWPTHYFQNPNPDEPIEKIWDTLDNYSFEELYQQPDNRSKIRLTIALPPLYHDNKFIKGFLFTQGLSVLLDQKPDIKKLFITCANSMTFSFPWEHRADCFFTCYENKIRETYYKIKYPETKNIVCLPLQDADYTNEEILAPEYVAKKDIDVLFIASPFEVKNFPIFAQTLKEYEKLYNKKLKVVVGLGSNNISKNDDGTLDYHEASAETKKIFAKITEILGNPYEYIDFIPYINYNSVANTCSRSKVGVLTTLYEGKNRFIHEAMSTGTPVIVFKDFNKFQRGDYPVFPKGCGEYAPKFTPQSLAKTIHKVISNPKKYKNVRENYLKFSGRKTFLRTVIEKVPYYQKNIPYAGLYDIFENPWINVAMQKNYNMTLEEFLFTKGGSLSCVVGENDALKTIKKYYSKFNLNFKKRNKREPNPNKTLFAKIEDFLETFFNKNQ